MNKIPWRSDGPETKFIENLFREGKVDSSMKPGVVQKKYPIFKGFSAAVFRKNYGLAKDKCCPNTSTIRDLTMKDMFADHEAIEELDGMDDPADNISNKHVNESGKKKSIEFFQAPVITCVFTDPVTKQEKCLVVLILYSGVKGLNTDIIMKENGCEQTLVVTYNWPTPMYDLVSMFKRDRDGAMLANNTHPKVLAVEKALQQYRGNIEDAPVASIEIALPVEVNMDPKTWTKTCNLKDDGNAVIFIELECRRRDYVISKNEKFLKIE